MGTDTPGPRGHFLRARSGQSLLQKKATQCLLFVLGSSECPQVTSAMAHMESCSQPCLAQVPPGFPHGFSRACEGSAAAGPPPLPGLHQACGRSPCLQARDLPRDLPLSRPDCALAAPYISRSCCCPGIAVNSTPLTLARVPACTVSYTSHLSRPHRCL